MSLRRRVTSEVRARVADSQGSFAGGMVEALNSAPATNGQLPINTTRPYTLDQAASLTNVRVLPGGMVHKRGGFVAIAGSTPFSAMGTAPALISGHYHAAWDAAPQDFVCMADTFSGDRRLYRSAADTESNGLPSRSFTLVGTIAAPALAQQYLKTPHSMASFLPVATNGETLFIADGGRLLSYANGVALSRSATTPDNITQLAVYNNRLFGITSLEPNANLLYWSALSDGGTLGVVASGGGFATVNRAGGPLTAIVPLGNSLLIFQQDAISRFTGVTVDDIGVATGVQGVSATVGTSWPQSIVALPGRVLFMNGDGLYQATEYGVERMVADIIEPSLMAFDGGSNGIRGNRIKAVHNPVDHEIWYFFGRSVVNANVTDEVGTIYVYNYQFNCWYRFTVANSDTGLLAGWVSQGRAGSSLMLITGHYATAGDPGLVYHLSMDDMTRLQTDADPATSASAACVASFTTRPLDGGDSSVEKVWTDAYLHTTTRQALTVTVTTPRETTVVAVPLSTAEGPRRIPLGQRSGRIQLTVAEAAGNSIEGGFTFGRLDVYGTAIRRGQQ